MDLAIEHKELEKMEALGVFDDDHYKDNVILPTIEDQEYRWGEGRLQEHD